MKPDSAEERRAPARGFLRDGAVRGRVSLVTFFAREKKVTRPTGAEQKTSKPHRCKQAKPATVAFSRLANGERRVTLRSNPTYELPFAPAYEL